MTKFVPAFDDPETKEEVYYLLKHRAAWDSYDSVEALEALMDMEMN